MMHKLHLNLTLATFCFFTVCLLGCSASKPPKQYTFENKRTFQYDQERVWTSVVEYFAQQNIPIKNMEKVSGFIATEYWIDPTWSQGGILDADCGEWGDAVLSDLSVQFNVFVKNAGDSQTSVQVNTVWRGVWKGYNIILGRTVEKPVTCTSTGKLEMKVIEGIRARL